MKGLMEREFIAQLVIILGVSLGGWALFVQPKIRKFDELQSVFRAVPQDPNIASQGSIENLANMLADGQQFVGAIAYRNKLAENVTLLYGMISDLGARHHVTVQSLTPVARPGSPSAKDFSALRIDMVLEGGYDSIALFVESVNGLPGFIRPVGLTIKPAGEVSDGLATANYSCEILNFDVATATNTMRAGR